MQLENEIRQRLEAAQDQRSQLVDVKFETAVADRASLTEKREALAKEITELGRKAVALRADSSMVPKIEAKRCSPASMSALIWSLTLLR